MIDKGKEVTLSLLLTSQRRLILSNILHLPNNVTIWVFRKVSIRFKLTTILPNNF